MLRGRRREQEALDRLIAGVREGHSAALVLRGEPGIGKTALLDFAVRRGDGARVLWVRGVEPEMELAFAGLHQLCAPLLDLLDMLPDPQREALRVALGMSSDDSPPDPFLVGLGVLGLLSEAAAERPVLCVVDDADWLDRESLQTLAFVARRLGAESVAILFAIRAPVRELAGLSELELSGLADGDARALLGSVIQGPLDERVRERVLAETRGNPLALLELPRGLTPSELAGGFGLPGAQPLSERIEQSFLRRVQALPEPTRLLLALAAAEPIGDPALLWRAAERLGLSADDGAPAKEAGLLVVGAAVRFRHPLVRVAAYRAATPVDQRRVHGALADATDVVTDPEQRAWHRAQAALGPDEDVARELERSAGRARSRGGMGAAAAFLERATTLTPDPAERARRALDAAQAMHAAGSAAKAVDLLVPATAGSNDELQLARLDRLRGEIEFSRQRGSGAVPLLLEAADRLGPLDPALARETYLEAMWASLQAGRLAPPDAATAVAIAALSAPPAPSPPGAIDLALDGLATRQRGGYEAAYPILLRALDAFEAWSEARWLSLAGRIAVELWDERRWREFSGRVVPLARQTGALNVLPMALNILAGTYFGSGRFTAAQTLIEDADAIADATGNARSSDIALQIRAWRGEEGPTGNGLDAARRDAEARGDGRLLTVADYAAAVLHNGHGRYDAALTAARAADERHELAFEPRVLPELIEAAARSGDIAVARAALDRLAGQARLTGSEWALGVHATGLALISEGDVAEALYREGAERLDRTGVVIYQARAHLLYGEWLRRERRRLDARNELRLAHDAFTAMGATAFAERASREIAATGEHARMRTVATLDQLTPQEERIARLASRGSTNQEIGAQLFISPRTVEYHLHKVFNKLDITSRAQLAQALD